MKYILLLALFLFTCKLHAQNSNFLFSGAKIHSFGNIGTLTDDVYSLVNNQAGLSDLTSTSFFISAQRTFMVDGLNIFNAGAAFPTKSGTFGLALNYFGFQAYNEQKIGLSYARELFDNFAIGAQIDYINTRIPDYGNLGVLTFELGLQATVFDDWKIGSHLYSPVTIRLTDTDIVPTTFAVGVAYLPSDKLSLMGEVEKTIDLTAIFKAGLDYKLSDPLSIRAGIMTNPLQNTFGLGLHLKQIDIDLATAYHPTLGLTTEISCLYNLN